MATSVTATGVTMVLADDATWTVAAGASWEETPDINGYLAVTVYGTPPDDAGEPPKLASCSNVVIAYLGGSAAPGSLSTAPSRGL